MRIALLALMVLLAACAKVPSTPRSSAPTPGEFIEIGDYDYESDHHLSFEPEYRFEREGEFYVRGSQRIPVAFIEYLRSVALTAPTSFEVLPPEIGITPEVVLLHELDILDAGLAEQDDILSISSERLAVLTGYENVRKVALGHLTDSNLSTNRPLLRIILPGDPRITLSTESFRPWLQPWKVEVGEEERVACSIELSLAVAVLVDPRGPNARRLNGAAYWADGFWNDSDVWGDAIGNEVSAAHGLALCAELDGYEELNAQFTVIESFIGNVNMQELSLYTRLEAKGAMLVDHLSVWNMLLKGEPAWDWQDCLAVHKECTEALKRFPALLAWQAAGPDRHFSLNIVGNLGLAETDPQAFLLPPWRHAGLKGRPEIELGLRIGEKYAGGVVFSPVADGGILLYAEVAFPESKNVTYHPQSPDYALLHPDGRIEFRTVK